MVSQVERAVVRSVPRGRRVLVAVSGGVDSVCLVAALARVASSRSYYLEAAHVDHGARPESGDDAVFVQRTCEQLGVSVVHQRRLGEVPEHANAEQWWRGERYRFFQEMMDERGLDLLVTAHHRDDLVETVLSRLLMNRELVGPDPEDLHRRLVRPFLTLPKETLLKTVVDWGLPWREDTSNALTNRTRNRVRHLLIPFLQAELGTSANTLFEQSERLSEDTRFFWALAEKSCSALASFPIGSRDWTRKLALVVKESEPPMQWRIVSTALLPLIGYPLGPRHGRRFIAFLFGDRREFQCAGRRVIVKVSGGLQCCNSAQRIEERLE